jgi:twitching motility two-component system response regulator PilH
MALFERLFRRKNPWALTLESSPVERRRQARTLNRVSRTVLIVDDSKTVVAQLGLMMHQNKFEVLEAFDGESALELLSGVRVDLIFLDIVLPGITGFEVLRQIRRNPKLASHSRIIVMSGNEAATEEYYVKRIGADEFLRKPFSRASVFATVEKVLGLTPHVLDHAKT